MKDFYIDKYHPNSKGPLIFASRLKDELEKQGHKFDRKSKNKLSIITGRYKEGAKNMLRLDGLYLDSKNTKGRSRALNKKIFPQSVNLFQKVLEYNQKRRKTLKKVILKKKITGI